MSYAWRRKAERKAASTAAAEKNRPLLKSLLIVPRGNSMTLSTKSWQARSSEGGPSTSHETADAGQAALMACTAGMVSRTSPSEVEPDDEDITIHRHF